MLVWFLCKQGVSVSTVDLLGHFKRVHGLCGRNGRYSCCQRQCCRIFTDKYSFIKHLTKCHSSDLNDDSSVNSVVKPVNVSVISVDKLATGSTDNDNEMSAEQIGNDHKQKKKSLKELAMTYICEAKSRVSTVENVNFMVNACSDMLVTILESLFDDIINLIDIGDVGKNLYTAPFCVLRAI